MQILLSLREKAEDLPGGMYAENVMAQLTTTINIAAIAGALSVGMKNRGADNDKRGDNAGIRLYRI